MLLPTWRWSRRCGSRRGCGWIRSMTCDAGRRTSLGSRGGAASGRRIGHVGKVQCSQARRAPAVGRTRRRCARDGDARIVGPSGYRRGGTCRCCGSAATHARSPRCLVLVGREAELAMLWAAV